MGQLPNFGNPVLLVSQKSHCLPRSGAAAYNREGVLPTTTPAEPQRPIKAAAPPAAAHSPRLEASEDQQLWPEKVQRNASDEEHV